MPLNTINSVIRPGPERFHSQLDWLDSWHTFSFSNHWDPAWVGFGPLCVINDDTIAAGRGFGMHPHRDMEIVTVMVEGELTHTDSMGHSEVLKAGEVQRMSAGTGIVHSEMNHSNAPCRLLQIWIEPEETAIQPAYDQRSFAVNRDWTPLICPEPFESTMTIARNMQLLRAKPQLEDILSVPKSYDNQQWIQVIEGTLELMNNDGSTRLLRRGDGIGFNTNHSGFEMKSNSNDTDILMFTMM